MADDQPDYLSMSAEELAKLMPQQPNPPPTSPAPAAPEERPDYLSMTPEQLRAAGGGPSGPEIYSAAPYGATDALAHGFTFGLSDPASALGTATSRFLRGQGWDYSQAAKEEQAGRLAYEAAHPYLSTALNVTGGFGTFGPGLAAVRSAAAPVVTAVGDAAAAAPGFFRQMAKNAGFGALAGSVQGAADNTTSLADAAMGAAQGGGTGLVIGGALYPFGRAAGATYDAARSLFTPADVAERDALTMIRRSIDQSVRGGGPGIPEMRTALDATNLPLMPLDVGGAPVQTLGGKLYRSDTPASQVVESALTNRDAGAGPRLVTSLERGMTGGPVPPAFSTAEALTTAQKGAADPLYRSAFNSNPSISSPTIDSILATPLGQTALANARTKMLNDRVLLPNAPLGAANPDGTTSYNLRTLDYVKQAMGDAISDAQKNAPTNVRIFTGMKNDLVRELDAADSTAQPAQFLRNGMLVSPAQPGHYAQARAAYAGPAEAKDALEMGRNFRNMAPDEIQSTMNSLSPGNQDMFRIGAVETIKRGPGGILKTGQAGNEALALSRNQDIRNQMRPLFNSDAEFNHFMDNVVAPETTMFRTQYRTMGNSMTAQRNVADASGRPVSDLAMPIAVAAISGHPAAIPATVAAHALPGIWSRAMGNTPQAMTEAARLLTASNPAQRQMVLDMLLPRQRPLAPYLAPTAGLLSGVRTAAPGLLGMLAGY